MSINLLNLPGALEALALKFATAKYIEAAGPTPAEQLARAQTVKAIASMVDGAGMGTTTIAQLQTMATTELQSKSLTVSNQLLVTGLVGLIGSVLPTAGASILSTAIAAEANVFLQDVIAVCTSFGA